MGVTTNISWATATWNPWTGCTHVSPGCDNCYMFAAKQRYGQDPRKVTRSAPPTFNLPLRKDRAGAFKLAPGSSVFTCSWSDWFHPVADPWRDEAWEIVRKRRDLLFLILTKRPERISKCLPADWMRLRGDSYALKYGDRIERHFDNVILGISAEDQPRLDERWGHLREIDARMRMISFEPLLGNIIMDRSDPEWWTSENPQLWAVIGGESGANHRPSELHWITELARELDAGGALVHVKQDSGLHPGSRGRIPEDIWALKQVPNFEVAQ